MSESVHSCLCVCVSAKTHKNKSLQEKNQEKDDDT